MQDHAKRQHLAPAADGPPGPGVAAPSTPAGKRPLQSLDHRAGWITEQVGSQSTGDQPRPARRRPGTALVRSAQRPPPGIRHQFTRFSRPAQNGARNSVFSTLPAPDSGSGMSRIIHAARTLVVRDQLAAMRDHLRFAVSVRPARGTTMACTASPHCSSGIADHRTSATPSSRESRSRPPPNRCSRRR